MCLKQTGYEDRTLRGGHCPLDSHEWRVILPPRWANTIFKEDPQCGRGQRWSVHDGGILREVSGVFKFYGSLKPRESMRYGYVRAWNSQQKQLILRFTMLGPQFLKIFPKCLTLPSTRTARLPNEVDATLQHRFGVEAREVWLMGVKKRPQGQHKKLSLNEEPFLVIRIFISTPAEVLIPCDSSTHFSMRVPTSAIRSATCQVELDSEAQCLKILPPSWKG